MSSRVDNLVGLLKRQSGPSTSDKMDSDHVDLPLLNSCYIFSFHDKTALKKIIRHWQQDTLKIDEREMANVQTKDLCCKLARVVNTLSTLPAAGCLDDSNHERRAIKTFVEQCCTGIPTPIVLSVMGKEYM
ncbi:hypothetical protein PS15p_204947 [Mucor circinelloides]